MEPTSLFLRFAASLIVGALVGLQREYSYDDPDREMAAGVRTFALIGLIGCTAACLADLLDSTWPFVAVVFIFGLLLAVNYSIEAWRGFSGLTTEVSAIITLMTGSLIYLNMMTLAVAIAVATTVVLSIKLEMKHFVEHITRADVFSTLKFAVITAIVLPVLPNKPFGLEPFNLFNPYKIWLLVVFISGISFVGYVLIKVVGQKKGISLTGLLGGLASSTAVTLSFTQRSRTAKALSASFALAIIIAWTVMFTRVLIEVAAVNAALIRLLWLPLVASIAVGLVYCFYLFYRHKSEENEEVDFSNPFELGLAIKFGLIFTLILLISKAAQIYLGNTGIYIASILSGLADVDAIALSMANLSRDSGGIDQVVAAKAIVFAALSNTFAKGSIVLIGGASALRKAILPGFLLMIVTGLMVVFIIY